MAKRIMDEVPESSFAPTSSKVKVTVDILNVRGTPDTFGPVIGTVLKGETFDKLGEVNGFIKIGDNQWIASMFVKEV